MQVSLGRGPEPGGGPPANEDTPHLNQTYLRFSNMLILKYSKGLMRSKVLMRSLLLLGIQ